MAFNGKITISELARILNISRPTLYKYVDEYENKNYFNLPSTIVEVFNYIYSDKSYNKNDIMQFCIKSNELNTRDFVLDKIKMLMQFDADFSARLIEFVDNYYQNNFRKKD